MLYTGVLSPPLAFIYHPLLHLSFCHTYWIWIIRVSDRTTGTRPLLTAIPMLHCHCTSTSVANMTAQSFETLELVGSDIALDCFYSTTLDTPARAQRSSLRTGMLFSHSRGTIGGTLIHGGSGLSTIAAQQDQMTHLCIQEKRTTFGYTRSLAAAIRTVRQGLA